MNRIILAVTLCFVFVVSASAAPATATVSVDCNKGQKISNALNNPALNLTIEITGICEEDVEISRTHVTLRGSSPLTDGIRPAPNGLKRQVITLVGTNFINIENLSLSGAVTGIGINYTFGVFVVDCIIKDNSLAGVIAGTASGSLNVVDTVITSTGGASNRAIWATNGSNITCTRCEIDNHRTGILLTQGSQANITDSTVLATRRGVDASGGSRFISFFSTTSSTIEGGTEAAIQLTDNASASIFDGADINGRIRLAGKSVARLWGSSQSNPSFFNSVESGSSLMTRSSTSLDGDIDISEFSTVTLPGGSTTTGSLFCSLGGDAVCDTPLTATLASDCGQCPNP